VNELVVFVYGVSILLTKPSNFVPTPDIGTEYKKDSRGGKNARNFMEGFDGLIHISENNEE